ncbi:phage tail protein [Bradyrhizobium sp. I71]|uniref:phage tail protein n=1 Tax=Bradyrhizobium sp. I71 TaxID=2590772 RepID=UPI001EF80DAF|nr:phage tail protein [Bradyrhizobium sp. I71]ULK98837.1 hypothetical protein FJV43_03575 [Bradyrhizobium sp. I71]
MAETVGALIFASIEAAGVAGAASLGTTAIVGTLTVNAVVGAAVLTAATIGLQYALNNPQVPKPENGAQVLRQAVPPRQRGYWINRLGGAYMFYEADSPPSRSYDVIAFHSGPVETLLSLYLGDDVVTTTPSVLTGGAGSVDALSDGSYGGNVAIQTRLGGLTPAPMTSMPANWDSAHVGNGIAYASVICTAPGNPEDFTKKFPRGRPDLSVVARCAPVFDPRDGAQSRSNRSTWLASPNPVLQLMDYITEADGGMGEEFDVLFPPDVLAQWMVEAELCDNDVGGRLRYKSAGFYQFDNSPENVVNKILATCDGWMVENGDGSLALTVGVYRDPVEPPLTSDHILGWSWRRGQADEESVNQLDVTYTNPDLAYTTDQIDSVRDEAAIARAGIVRAKPLDLSWVQDADQAATLAGRALLRLNSAMAGTFVTTLYGLRYLGQRWVRVQLPAVRGLEDCVVEIQDRGAIDLVNGRVTFSWNLVDPDALLALQ